MRAIPAWIASLGLFGCMEPHPQPRERCLTLPPPEGAPIAQVGDTPLTVSQLLRRIQSQGSGAVRRYGTKAKARAFVEDQIRFELLVQAALDRGLDRDPQVVDAARKVMVRKLLQRDLGDSVFEGKVGEAAIEAYYARHLDEYTQPETRRIAEIQLKPTEEGRALAVSILQKLTLLSDPRLEFRTFARSHSLNRLTKNTGGELQHKTREELEKAYGKNFADVIFGVDPGVLLQEPVQSTLGWHVVHTLSRRDALARELDTVRDEIREKLLRGQRAKVFDQYLGDIKQRHPVALHQTQLDALVQALEQSSGDP